MEENIRRLIDSVGNIFAGGDTLPFCGRDTIAGCEREVAEAASDIPDELKNESLTRLSWALVHSRYPADMQRGIAMLEASLVNVRNPLHEREKLYLLAVGYYRTGDYSRSRQFVEGCLEIAPDWRQARTLKSIVENQIAKDGLIGMGITATALGLIVGGIAAALAHWEKLHKRFQEASPDTTISNMGLCDLTIISCKNPSVY
ncbi:Fis1, N-terminal tetratricopeptide repeat [Dillenia turbinata]|uniref:Fis1, N-terminal tetratricopeptide repeat n=1 Tax=Dillenia turbinata TaxID=194707 RepID=A0AAN8W316_9MAGN